MFGVTAIAFLGMVGMATEAGNWYLANRSGQNAADAAAVAGAMTLALSSGNDASSETAVRNTATRNGYTTGGNIVVIANHPPVYGAYTANNGAVEAIINQTYTGTFSNLFGISSKVVGNRAVALVQSSGNACVLALTNSLTLSGNFTVNAPNCMLASNYQSNTSINISGGPTVNVQSLTAVGLCNGCTNAGVTTQTPYTSYGTPTQNPFEALDTTNFTKTDCDNSNYGTGQQIGGTAAARIPFFPTYAKGGAQTNTQGSTANRTYCGEIKVQNGDYVDFRPGTYYLYTADFIVTGGDIVCSTCTADNGVHFVLIGNNANKSDININGGSVQLSAGSAPPGPGGTTITAMAGVLFYRSGSIGNGGGDEVTINGGAGTVLTGGTYFPNADGKYNGNGSSTCTILVGGAITMNGTATLNQTGCANIGLNPVQTQIVRIVE